MPNFEQYVHVLLFACPHCGLPLTATCLSGKRNLEIAEANWFKPACQCGRSVGIPGVAALRHWVEPWPYVPPVAAGEPGTCKEAIGEYKR